MAGWVVWNGDFISSPVGNIIEILAVDFFVLGISFSLAGTSLLPHISDGDDYIVGL